MVGTFSSTLPRTATVVVVGFMVVEVVVDLVVVLVVVVVVVVVVVDVVIAVEVVVAALDSVGEAGAQPVSSITAHNI